MQERNAVNFDAILNELRHHYVSQDDHVKRIIQFCREADLATAESAVTNDRFCTLYDQLKYGAESVVVLLLRKVLANKTSEQLLQFLVVNLPKNKNNIFLYNELNQVFLEKLKNNSEFRKLFISSPSSHHIENVLIEYCRYHPDQTLQELLAEYQRVQNTPEMLKKRQINLEDGFREVYGLPKFPHPLSSYQNDMIQITLFLSNPERMKLRLKELETLIESKAKSEFRLEVSDEKSCQLPKLKGYLKGQPYKENKLFSSTLYALSKKFGFKEPLKVSQILSSKDFYQMLKEKRLFKDLSLGFLDTHGEWTHFIQWICIALENQAHPSFLNNPVASIYQWIGQQAESADSIKHLWTYTFDSFPGLTEFKLDFRAPENLYKYLLTSTEAATHFPLMQQLLQGRLDKRMQQHNYTSCVAGLKFLCNEYSKDKTVNELKVGLESMSKKPIKSANLLKTFGIYFQKVKNQLPPEFVAEVGRRQLLEI